MLLEKFAEYRTLKMNKFSRLMTGRTMKQSRRMMADKIAKAACYQQETEPF